MQKRRVFRKTDPKVQLRRHLLTRQSVRSRLPTDWPTVTGQPWEPCAWAPPSSSRSALRPHTQLHWACLPGQLLVWRHPPFSSSEQGRDQEGQLTETCHCKGTDTERSCRSQAQPGLGRVTSRAGLRQLEPRGLEVQSPLLLSTCQRIRGDAPQGYRCPATSIGPCAPSLDTSWVDPPGRKGSWRLVTSRGGGTYQRLSGVYFSNSNFGNLKNYN